LEPRKEEKYGIEEKYKMIRGKNKKTKERLKVKKESRSRFIKGS
jgi:hypothetical protein